MKWWPAGFKPKNWQSSMCESIASGHQSPTGPLAKAQANARPGQAARDVRLVGDELGIVETQEAEPQRLAVDDRDQGNQAHANGHGPADVGRKRMAAPGRFRAKIWSLETCGLARIAVPRNRPTGAVAILASAENGFKRRRQFFRPAAS